LQVQDQNQDNSQHFGKEVVDYSRQLGWNAPDDPVVMESDPPRIRPQKSSRCLARLLRFQNDSEAAASSSFSVDDPRDAWFED